MFSPWMTTGIPISDQVEMCHLGRKQRHVGALILVPKEHSAFLRTRALKNELVSESEWHALMGVESEFDACSAIIIASSTSTACGSGTTRSTTSGTAEAQ
jgi:hypothetical protein